MSRTRILVTGGAGFIGSAVVRELLAQPEITILVADKLTYAGAIDARFGDVTTGRLHVERVDICDRVALDRLIAGFQPEAVLHLAAETHVDRSIDAPAPFIHSNIVGTFTLLEAARCYWESMSQSERNEFRFVHVSTDEVFGALGDAGCFDESSPYRPNSPYAASKASSDHLVRAWYETYGLPTIITNCSNNYGPYQYPEKLIPVVILNGINGRPIPLYGAGDQVRDWLFVEDHARALALVLKCGRTGETYAISGRNERRNVDLAHAICDLLDERLPGSRSRPHRSLISFVADRPGHDRRYALDSGKIERELGWSPRESLDSGLVKTVDWYLGHQAWCDALPGRQSVGERRGLLR